MSAGDIIVALVVAAGLSFDFTNGFHDTANAMATTIATGALPPKVAVTIAAILNFLGAFISLSVAATVAEGIVEATAITPIVILGGLVGAISWNLATRRRRPAGAAWRRPRPRPLVRNPARAAAVNRPVAGPKRAINTATQTRS